MSTRTSDGSAMNAASLAPARDRRRARRRAPAEAQPVRQEAAAGGFLRVAAAAGRAAAARRRTASIFQVERRLCRALRGQARAPRRRSADDRAGRAHRRVQIGRLEARFSGGGFAHHPADHRPARRCSTSTDASVSGTRNFNGTGTADQSNALSGEVSVTVAEVYPNGTMLVQGQKRVTLNRGDEFVQIKGIVRIADIDAEQPHRSRPASPMPASPIPARATSPAPAARAGSAASSRSSARSDRSPVPTCIRFRISRRRSPPCWSPPPRTAERDQGSRRLPGHPHQPADRLRRRRRPARHRRRQSRIYRPVDEGASPRASACSCPPGVNPGLKNAAVVMITAELPPSPSRASSSTSPSRRWARPSRLRGGTLILTPLLGADGQIYAMAQGNLAVGGLGAEGADGSKIVVNIPSTGRIPEGATVERAVETGFDNTPDADLQPRARRLHHRAERRGRDQRAASAPARAQAIDGVSVAVRAPPGADIRADADERDREPRRRRPPSRPPRSSSTRAPAPSSSTRRCASAPPRSPTAS